VAGFLPQRENAGDFRKFGDGQVATKKRKSAALPLERLSVLGGDTLAAHRTGFTNESQHAIVVSFDGCVMTTVVLLATT